MYPMIDALKKTFAKSNLGKKAMAAAVAVPMALVSFGPAANPAHAGEANAATVDTTASGERAIDKARAMRKYSEDPAIQGVGVFINLQHDLSEDIGNQVGEKLKRAFATKGVEMDYRINQSRGTATDLTFYVRGVPYVINIRDVKSNLGQVLATHQGTWLPEKVSMLETSTPQ